MADKTIDFPGDAHVGLVAGRWSYTQTGDIAAQFDGEGELSFILVASGLARIECDPAQAELMRQNAAAWLEKTFPYTPHPEPKPVVNTVPEPVVEPVMEIDGQATLFDVGTIPVRKKKGRYQ